MHALCMFCSPVVPLVDREKRRGQSQAMDVDKGIEEEHRRRKWKKKKKIVIQLRLEIRMIGL